MSAIEVTDQGTRTALAHWVSLLCFCAAAGLFLASAALQLIASLERWVVFRGSLGSLGEKAEDHLYDYSLPSGDGSEWENVGTAAQLFGAGTLLLAPGILVMALGVWTLPGTTVLRFSILPEIVLALLAATLLGINGAHALLSGLADSPSPLQDLFNLGFVSFVALVALGALWLRRSRPAAVACAFLTGASLVGYIMATYLIAPLISGGSYDTAPWTETVVAATAAAAGFAMLFAVRGAIRRHVQAREIGVVATLSE